LDLHESGNIGYAIKRTSIAIGFRFFNFSSEYLKRLQSYELLHTKMNLTSCLFGSRFVWNPFLLLAGALLFDEKIRRRTALCWFGLRDVGILHSRAVIQRTIVVSPAFLEHNSAEKFAFCANKKPWSEEAEGLEAFLYLAKIKNQKP
jgi:hypothetical protein